MGIARSMAKDKKTTYPYFDTGLGREITSPGHRRQVMKELGAEEVGNELDAVKKARYEAEHLQSLTTVDEVAKTMAEIKEKLVNPDYRAYHENKMTPEEREKFEKEWRH